MGVYTYEKAGKRHYYYAFDVRDKTRSSGRRTIKERGFTHERAARAAEREARNKWEAEKHLDPSALTFGEYLLDFVSKKQGLEPETLENYEGMIRKNIATHPLGKKLPPDITVDDIERFIKDLQGKGLASATVRRYFSIINSGLNSAARKEHILKNPTDKLDSKPRVTRRGLNYWTADEVRDFLSKAKHEYLIIVILAVHCGMREAEIVGLDRKLDIDLVNKRLHIRQVLKDSGRMKPGAKSMSGNRSIAISDYVVSAIKEHIAKQDLTYHGQSMLLCTRTGSPYRPAYVRNMWRNLLKQTGARRIKFHDLRHTCASLLLQAGKHPKIVQELLGHASIKMTLDLYSHLMPGMNADAANTMSDLLG